MPSQLSEYSGLAERVARFEDLKRLARAETLTHFRAAPEISNKANQGAFDPVTEADRACERAMRNLIEQAFPTDGIIGEEYGNVRPEASVQWIIDPIDGTRAYVAGVPLWGSLVGIVYEETPVAGMGYQPFLDESFEGSAAGALWKMRGAERELQTRACQSFSEATLMTTTPSLFQGQQRAAYDRLEAACRNVRYGTDWYGYALVAAGTCDLVVETGLALYDILPLVPIIEGSGGIVTDWGGAPLRETGFTGQVLAAGDRGLHQQALKLLRHAAV
ncbi:MAG: histidinol-phosphatase [Pseudomonadota bacterium]